MTCPNKKADSNECPHKKLVEAHEKIKEGVREFRKAEKELKGDDHDPHHHHHHHGHHKHGPKKGGCGGCD